MSTHSTAHVIVADIAFPELDGSDRHHLERVLRVGPKEVVTATNGAGAWRTTELVAGNLIVTSDIQQMKRPEPLLAMGVALLKGDRTELVVQKLTELGIDDLWPLATSRGGAEWTRDKADRHMERLRRVARQALMQSRGMWLPQIHDLASVGDFLTETGGVLADFGGGPLRSGLTSLAIGPEGGWTDEERSLSAIPVTLGTTVLRAETASIVAAGLLVGCRGGVVSPGS